MSFNTEPVITLNLLKCFRHFAQAAARIACAVVSVVGILFISAANAVAPIHDGIQIQQTPKQYAKAVLPIDQYKCIAVLYGKESAWSHTAYNKSSGAAGIPQGKSVWLRSATPIEQVKWGISYIQNRYQTPCNALQHFRKWNWH
jgi:hypothetical protein